MQQNQCEEAEVVTEEVLTGGQGSVLLECTCSRPKTKQLARTSEQSGICSCSNSAEYGQDKGEWRIKVGGSGLPVRWSGVSGHRDGLLNYRLEMEA